MTSERAVSHLRWNARSNEAVSGIRPAVPADFPALVAIWESSVRATHDFLTEADIDFYRPLVFTYLPTLSVCCLVVSPGEIAGFVAVGGDQIEMLFIDARARGRGAGKALLTHAVDHMGAFRVDVNEQNTQAVGFYRHAGFQVTGRSLLDGTGKAFPLLHMSVAAS